MADLTLHDFECLFPGKQLGEMLREETRRMLGEPEPAPTPGEKEREEAPGQTGPHNLCAWFLRSLRTLASAVQIR